MAIQAVHKARGLLRKMMLGEADLPLTYSLGLHLPQNEVAVWLHGMGEPRDVTQRHSVACTNPFLLCIGFDGEEPPPQKTRGRLSLRFCERNGERRLLGEIGLCLSDMFPPIGSELYLFEAKSCTNFCLSRARSYTHDLYQAYIRWRNRKTANVRMATMGSRCNAVVFICPRPVVLVSLRDGERGNVFPMNLMGPVGEDRFAFALNATRRTAAVVERLGEVAFSSVPFDKLSLAREMGRNHHRELIEWEQLPFQMRRSETLGIPVPEFAQHVRELKIETVRRPGSHTFFVARMVGETNCGDGPEFCMTLGLYEAWRQRNGDSIRQLISIAGSV
jgi:flavin reductase (DIM6/NTAB) family NADH-FMN oxidoreductase RutF